MGLHSILVLVQMIFRAQFNSLSLILVFWQLFVALFTEKLFSEEGIGLTVVECILLMYLISLINCWQIPNYLELQTKISIQNSEVQSLRADLK